MNEFQEIIKEAFLGEESYDSAQGQVELKASIQKFESQDRLLRSLLWSSTLFMSALTFWSAWSFWHSSADESPKRLILYATLFLFSIQCVGMTKMFIFSNQKSFSILKELKRLQLAMLERSGS